MVNPSGGVTHWEGKRGAERTVRIVQPNGRVTHFEGEQGAERVL